MWTEKVKVVLLLQLVGRAAGSLNRWQEGSFVQTRSSRSEGLRFLFGIFVLAREALFGYVIFAVTIFLYVLCRLEAHTKCVNVGRLASSRS